MPMKIQPNRRGSRLPGVGEDQPSHRQKVGDQRDRRPSNRNTATSAIGLPWSCGCGWATRTRMLTAEQMERLFDETDEHNQERRQAFADYMGISLQQAIEESRSRRGFDHESGKLKWLETHGTGPYRHEMIADICDRLDEGEEMGVDYLYPGTGGPIRVTVRERAPSKERWVLDGLFPAECDTIRSHVCKEEWRDGPHPLHELCVIATLATILQGRGIRLDPCTVL